MRKSRALKRLLAAALIVCLCMLFGMGGTSLAAIQKSSGAVVNTFTAPEQSEPGDGDENGGDSGDTDDDDTDTDEGTDTDDDDTDDDDESGSDTGSSDDSSSDSDSDDGSTGSAGGAQTGDGANAALWACLAAVFAAGAIAVVVKIRKIHESEK